MAKYQATPAISSFGHEGGTIDADENGLFEIGDDNSAAFEALRAAGITIEVFVSPAEKEAAAKAAKEAADKAAKEAADKAAKEAAAAEKARLKAEKEAAEQAAKEAAGG